LILKGPPTKRCAHNLFTSPGRLYGPYSVFLFVPQIDRVQVSFTTVSTLSGSSARVTILFHNPVKL
jgi:hypothetical protein